MAALPPCSLCKTPEKISKYLENKKANFLKYAIFFILLIEWFSIIFLKNYEAPKETITNVYVTFVYPFLSQLSLFILFFSLFLWKDRLHFCYRKSATCFYLSLYYLFNVSAVILCFNGNIYYDVISYGSISIATFLFFVSLIKSK